jgi:hypothetical protein
MIRLKQQPPTDLMADQSVAGKTRFEKLDVSSVSPPGPLKMFGSYVGENIPEGFKKSRIFLRKHKGQRTPVKPLSATGNPEAVSRGRQKTEDGRQHKTRSQRSAVGCQKSKTK